MLVVTVRFELTERGFEPFRNAVLKNAAASLEEAGCRRFDVAFSGYRHRCFVYELYADDAAFGAHQETAHFREFSRTTAPYVKEYHLETFRLERNPFAKVPARADPVCEGSLKRVSH